MNVSQKLLWNIYAGAVGALSAVVAQKAVRGAWKVATGDEPPDPNDPATPAQRGPDLGPGRWHRHRHRPTADEPLRRPEVGEGDGHAGAQPVVGQLPLLRTR